MRVGTGWNHKNYCTNRDFKGKFVYKGPCNRTPAHQYYQDAKLHTRSLDTLHTRFLKQWSSRSLSTLGVVGVARGVGIVGIVGALMVVGSLTLP